MRTTIDLLILALLCTLGLAGSPANAALMRLNPIATGEIHESASLGSTPSQPLNFFYRHSAGLDALQFSSEVGFGPPPHATGDFGHRNQGYLVYDLGSLPSPVTGAFLTIALSATGGDLGYLAITLIRTLTGSALADLPPGSLSQVSGRSLMNDLANPAAGALDVHPGDDQFNVYLNTAGVNAINDTRTLLALGIAYNPVDPLYNARIAFAGAPVLNVEVAAIALPPTLPLLGCAWLIAVFLPRRSRLFQRRLAGRRRPRCNPE